MIVGVRLDQKTNKQPRLSGAQHCGYCIIVPLDTEEEEIVFNIYSKKACNCYCQPALFDLTVFLDQKYCFRPLNPLVLNIYYTVLKTHTLCF